MSNYEDRVIGLKFDNAQFERRAQKTLNTLDSMTQKIYTLGTRSVTSSFNSITNAASKVTFNPIINGLNNVALTFKNLETRAITSLETMAASAVNAGKQFAESLSVDQFASGWTKYEEKTAAIQTIVSAGYDIDEVNAAMEKLMWYADETSYNFTDMANNIGKFTSMGIDLDTATKSMMGISNWAAVSGQNASSASRAMYNLSQAIGMGKVTLRDWYSIENANMATKEFKETVLETAVELGELTKASDGTIKSTDGTVISYENFRDVLDKGFFTTEVLTKTLEKYSSYSEEVYAALQDETLGLETAAEAMEYVDKKAQESAESLSALGEKAFKAAQESKSLTDSLNATKDAVSSIWMRIIEDFTGGYYETKRLWTDFTAFLWEVFAGPLDEIESYLSKWSDTKWINDDGEELTEREHLLQVLRNTMNGIVDALKVAKDTLLQVFPAKTMKELSEMVEGWRSWSKQLVFTNSETGELTDKGKKLKKTLLGVFSTVKNIWNALKKIKVVLSPIINSIKELLAFVGDLFLTFNRAVPYLTKFQGTIEWISDSLLSVGAHISDMVTSIKNMLIPALDLIMKHGTIGFIASAVKILSKLSDTILDLFTYFTGIDTAVAKSTVKDYILTIATRIAYIFKIVQAIAPVLIQWILPVALALLQKVSQIIKVIINLAANIWKPLFNIFITLLNAGKKVLDAILEAAPDISNTLGKFLTAAQPIISKVIDILATAISFLIKKLPVVLNFLTSIITWVTEKGSAFIDWFKSAGSNTISGFFNGIKEGFKKTKLFEIFQSIITKVKDIFGIHSPSTVFFEIGKNVLLGLANGVKFIFGPLYLNLKKIVSKVVDLFVEIVDTVREIISELKSPFISAVKSVLSVFTKLIDKIEKSLDFDRVVGTIIVIAEKFSSIFTVLLDIIHTIISTISESGLIKSIVELFKSIVDGLKQIDIITPLFEGIKEVVGILKTLANAFASLISGDIFTKLADFMERTSAVKIIALATAIKMVIKAISKLITAIGLFKVLWNVGSVAGGVKNILKQFSEDIIDRIREIIVAIGIVFVAIIGIMMLAKNMDITKVASIFLGLTVVLISMGVLLKIASESNVSVEQLRSIERLSLVMIGIAGMLSVFALAVAPLSRGNWSSIIASALAMSVILASLIGTVELMVLMTKSIRLTDSFKEKILLLSGIMAIVGGVISAVAVSISALAKKKLKGILSATLSITVILTGLVSALAVIVSLAKWMKSNKTTTKNLYSLIGVMATIGGVLSIIASVMSVIKTVSWETIGQLGVILTGVLTGMAVLVLIAKKIKQIDMASIIMAMSSMITIVGSMAAITAILPKLADDKLWNSLAKAGTILAGLIVTVAALGAIGKFLGVGLGIATIAILGISVAFLTFSAAVYVMSAAVSLFATAFDTLVNVISSNSDEVKLTMTTLGSSLAAGFSAFLDEISNGIGSISTFIFNALLAVWNGIVDFMSGIVDKKDDLETIFAGLKAIVKSFIDNTLDLIEEEVPRVVNIVVSSISSALDSIEEYDIIGKAGTLFDDLLKTLDDNLPTITKTATDAISGLLDSVKALSPQLADTLSTLITDALTDLLSEEKIGTVVDAILDFVISLLGKLADKADDLVDGLVDVVVAILDAITENVSRLATSITDLVVALIGAITTSSIDITNALVDAIAAIISAVALTISEKGPDIVDALEKLVVAITYVFGYLVGKSLSAAGKGITAFIQGFWVGVTDLGKSISDVFKTIGNAFESIFDENSPSKEAFDIGEYLSEGLANGIEAGTDKVEVASTNAASKALWRMEKRLNEHSPSKEGEQIGEYLSEGFANGITEATPVATSAAETLADETVETLADETTESGSVLANALTNVLSTAESTAAENTSGSLLDMIKSLVSGDSSASGMDAVTWLSNLTGVDLSNLELGVSLVVDDEDLQNALNGDSSDSSSGSDDSSSGSTSTRVRSATLAASTSNAITRNVEAYAAQRDNDAATIQKILENMTSPSGYENTFYITNEDPETTANLVAEKLKSQVQSEALIWG